MSNFFDDTGDPILFSDADLPKTPPPSKAPPEGKVEICRPYITLKNGKRLFASAYGKKAFCFFVDA